MLIIKIIQAEEGARVEFSNLEVEQICSGCSRQSACSTFSTDRAAAGVQVTRVVVDDGGGSGGGPR